MYNYSLTSLAVYLTNWGMLCTILHLTLTIKCASDLKVKNKISLLGWNHIIFELTLILELVITVVYWTIIHHVIIVEEVLELVIFQLYLVHAFPFFSMVVNFLITDVVLIRSHQVKFLYIALIYLLVNFAATKIRGKPVYHFLTWEDLNSLYIFLGISLGALFVFNFLVTFSELLKGRKANEKSSIDKDIIDDKTLKEMNRK